MALLDDPKAVMIRTLVFGELTLSFDNASMPSSSGIRTSMITRSGLVSLTLSTTSVPVVASTTLYPSSDSSCLRSERMEASSSATRIVLCATFRTLPSHEDSMWSAGWLSSCGRTILCADDRTCQTAGGWDGRPYGQRSGHVADGADRCAKKRADQRNCASNDYERRDPDRVS